VTGAALALALIAPPLAAQAGPQPVVAGGGTLETSASADRNGYGAPDLAYIAAAEERRELRVVTSFVSTVENGENPAQVLALDHSPPARPRIARS
jgi:hypothetical protein